MNSSVGIVAANTSTSSSGGWLFSRCPPHFRQYVRWLSGVFWKVATCSAPDVIRRASGFHRLNALTGPPDQDRHERQWQ